MICILLLLFIFAIFCLSFAKDVNLKGFNPEVLSEKDCASYYNYPIREEANSADSLLAALSLPVGDPVGLIYEGSPPGSDAVVGIAVYDHFMAGFKRIVGSLRHYGYDGHIILGVSPKINAREIDYLKRMDVTLYTVEIVPCHPSILDEGNPKSAIRGKCAKSLETLKLEWGRFELARQWLTRCTRCTGMSMVMDTRDVFFQGNPFKDPVLTTEPYASASLLFIEEIAPYTCPDPDPIRSFVAGNMRSQVHVVPCYGKDSFSIYSKRPVMCSGTVMGTREGIYRFLSVLVYEFHENNKKGPQCRSPSTTDQWTMNWLYYNGRFGEPHKTRTVPWGYGPVNTVGKPCVTRERKLGAMDLVKRDFNGTIVNMHDGRVSATVHQFDRCGNWVDKYLKERSDVFSPANTDTVTVSWKPLY